ncbi:Bug family tripartite tricarboxylate transporter substrate binding protein [Variovorax sp. M-6]|uniref:Bug family tripartite tricarboxylate transporter substrate binding protein n=1 Tax=Variovorax sp. M-6 TaxID=3233041 RepID=UPI003F9939A2
MSSPLRHLLLPLGAALIALSASSVHAQAAPAGWPNKPIRVIVPYPAGGNSDAIGRFIADKLGAALGQSMVVDNRGGAGATIGADLAARAPGDGYTFMVAPTAVFAITPHLRKVPYSPFADFVPIAQLTGSYSIATARKDAPFNDVKELVAAARKAPGKYTFGSAGPATATHLAGEMVNYKAGISMLHVPYKGSAEALSDLMGGRIDMIYDPVSLTQVKAGKVKAIAVLSKTRHPELPDVPTIREQGYDLDTRSWFGLFAPKGTPKAVVDRTAAEVEKILATEEARQLLLRMSQYPEYVGPAAFAAQIKDDSTFFKDLIVRADIHVE